MLIELYQGVCNICQSIYFWLSDRIKKIYVVMKEKSSNGRHAD